MGIYDESGKIQVNVVDGTTRTGIYAADGSINIVVDDEDNTGVTHPCGALRANSGTGTETYDPSGAMYYNFLLGVGTPPLITIGAITDLVVTVDDFESVSLTYTPASGATSHEVRYRVSGEPSWGSWSTLVTDEVTGLEDATEYDFQVRGAVDLSKGPVSNIVTETTDRWIPTNLGSSLLGWWDASHGVTHSSGSVSAWVDRVGSYSAAEATNQPTYSATSFNGGPGITFDGTDDLLTVASQPFPSGTNSSEIWLVCDLPGMAASSQPLFAYGGSANGSVRRIVRASGNVLNFGADNTGTPVVVQDNSQDWGGRRVLRMKVTATELRYAIDGSALSSATALTPSTGTTRVRIGASTLASPTFGNVIFSDILITSALDNSQQTRMNKWALWRRG